MKPELEKIVRARLRRVEGDIARALELANAGNPLAAESDGERLRTRLCTKAFLSREEADVVADGIRARAARPRLATDGPERIHGRTLDFVSIAFLARGRLASRAVARVAYRDGRPLGSGFLVSDSLFLTNHHVIESERGTDRLCIEFDYELDTNDKPRTATRFALDPRRFFVTDSVKGLDYTLIAVGERLSGPHPLGSFLFCPLVDAQDKHALGEVANIVQHPDGRYKEAVLRENRLVSRLDFVLHYVADTEPGSSGSPVFNNEWEVIALHHWGGPYRQTTSGGKQVDLEVNEGIRISAIVKDLQARLASLPPERRELLRTALELGRQRVRPPEREASGADEGPSAKLGPDGSVQWRVPIEISVRMPNGYGNGHTPAPPASVVVVPPPGGEALRPSTDYSDRSGYKPRFIDDFEIPLPRLSAAQRKIAARNKEAGPGDDPFELKYHHFSVVMNRARRLAFFAACNIDGKTLKHVDRDTGDVSPIDPDASYLERIGGAEGAEAAEVWYDDERLAPEEYAGGDTYEKQRVPGYPSPNSKGRLLRMFQRGHLVSRMDPAWGKAKMARLADADTFHWTNCSPQVGFFNQGNAPKTTPKSGGGRLWRAVETYVLRNAVADEMRVSSFTGPIFKAKDRKFRSLQVPGRFWKIVAWADGGSLRALAMIADQRPVLQVWPESLEDEGAEAFADPDELDKVEDFLSTVAEIEKLTGLDFGEALRKADIRAGGESIAIVAPEEIPMRSRRPKRRTA